MKIGLSVYIPANLHYDIQNKTNWRTHYAFKTEMSLNNEPMFNKHCNNSHCIECNKGYKLMSWNVYNDFLKKNFLRCFTDRKKKLILCNEPHYTQSYSRCTIRPLESVDQVLLIMEKNFVCN